MKKLTLFITAIIFMVALIFSPSAVLAGSAKLSLTSTAEKTEIGKTFDITVRVDATEGIEYFGASITYDNKRLEFVSGGGSGILINDGTGGINGYGNENADCFEYTLTFKAKANGTAYFRLRNCEVIGIKSGSDILGVETARLVIIVGKSSGEPDEPEPSKLPTPSAYVVPEGTVIDDSEGLTITINGVTYNVFAEESLCGIMNASFYTYGGIIYPSYKTNSDEFLLLSTDGGNTFLLYSVNSHELFPLVVLNDNSVFEPTDPPEDAEKIEEIIINNITVKAVPTDNKDLFTVYCKEYDGSVKPYCYNRAENSMLPISLEDTASAAEAPSPTAEAETAEEEQTETNEKTNYMLLIIAGAAFIVLLILLIILLANGRDDR